MKEKNYFQASQSQPYHLSVGAVLVNQENKVVCHYFSKVPDVLPEPFKNITDIHILMRESMEMGETIEEALSRGLREEFGAEGKVIAFLGSKEEVAPGKSLQMIKTTLYFLVRMTSMDASVRESDDMEGDSEIVTLPIDVCVSNMKEQGKRIDTGTFDESDMILRAKEMILEEA